MLLDSRIAANTFQGTVSRGQCVAVMFFSLLVEGTDERGHFYAEKKVLLRDFGVGLVYSVSIFLRALGTSTDRECSSRTGSLFLKQLMDLGFPTQTQRTSSVTSIQLSVFPSKASVFLSPQQTKAMIPRKLYLLYRTFFITSISFKRPSR